MLQTVIAFLSGVVMSMYFVYYFYKAFQLTHLKFFATYGTILFILCPFVLLFAIPYYITNDLELCRKMLVVVPFIYSVAFIYSVTRAFILKFRKANIKLETNTYEEVVSVYLALLFFASLPIIVFFGDYQVLEHSLTNAGFLVMTITYIRSSIIKSKNEHTRLQKLNEKLTEEVNERTRKLEEANEQRTNTFINLAHETKTPLTLISNYLEEYIQKTGDSPELRIIKTNIQKLTSDIVNFFDVERFDKGIDIYSHDTTIDLSSLLNSSLTLFKSLASKKGIVIEGSIDPNIHIQAHPNAIERIFNNIMENSIRYTESGGYIKVTLVQEDNSIILSVSDTGIGIPQEMQEKIFEPYFRLNSGNKRNIEGVGMGLSIVKKIIESLQGRIVLTSKEKQGTEISIHLKRTKIYDATEIVSHQISRDVNVHVNEEVIRDEINDTTKPYILIVEDNMTMLAYLVMKLKQHYNVYVAKNGIEALHKLQTLKELDLIISDVMMDIMDGFELYRAILELKIYSHIPFIFLTAKNTHRDKLFGLQMGAIDYIDKPFLFTQLHQKIDSILSTLEKQRMAIVNSAYRNIRGYSEVNNLPVAKSQTIIETNCKKYGLTNREIEICFLIMKGLQKKVIAANLHIATNTVAVHVSNIFAKVNVKNRVELINKLEGSEINV